MLVGAAARSAFAQPRAGHRPSPSAPTAPRAPTAARRSSSARPASPFAVCSFCRSTVVRAGDALRKIGESAELFDDHSPLQLGAAGKLPGRARSRSSAGCSTATPTAPGTNGTRCSRAARAAEVGLALGGQRPLRRRLRRAAARRRCRRPEQPARRARRSPSTAQSWSVALGRRRRKLIAAAGRAAAAGRTSSTGFVVADLRSSRAARSARIDYTEPGAADAGRSAARSSLARARDDRPARSRREDARRPHARSARTAARRSRSSWRRRSRSSATSARRCVDVVSRASAATSRTTRRTTAASRRSRSARVGTLALGAQPAAAVAGRRLRRALRGRRRATSDEQTFWREYLLYHRTEGFAFIVDAEDGWSWTAPITGAPQVVRRRASSTRACSTRKLYDYTGKVTYVLGEFYWRLTRDQRTAQHRLRRHRRGGGSKRLNREQHRRRGQPQEVVWSARRDARAPTR